MATPTTTWYWSIVWPVFKRLLWSTLIAIVITVCLTILTYRKSIAYILFGDDRPLTLTEINTELNRKEGGTSAIDYRRRRLRRQCIDKEEDDEEEERRAAERTATNGSPAQAAAGNDLAYVVKSRPVPIPLRSCLRPASSFAASSTVNGPTAVSATTSPALVLSPADGFDSDAGGSGSERSGTPTRRVRLVEPEAKSDLEALREQWAAAVNKPSASTTSPQVNGGLGASGTGVGGYRRTRDIYMRGQGGSAEELAAKAERERERASAAALRVSSGDDTSASDADAGSDTTMTAPRLAAYIARPRSNGGGTVNALRSRSTSGSPSPSRSPRLARASSSGSASSSSSSSASAAGKEAARSSSPSISAFGGTAINRRRAKSPISASSAGTKKRASSSSPAPRPSSESDASAVSGSGEAGDAGKDGMGSVVWTTLPHEAQGKVDARAVKDASCQAVEPAKPKWIKDKSRKGGAGVVTQPNMTLSNGHANGSANGHAAAATYEDDDAFEDVSDTSGASTPTGPPGIMMELTKIDAGLTRAAAVGAKAV